MHNFNDPTTLTFDTSVELSLSDENDISNENDEVLDLCSFWEPEFGFEKGKHWRNISDIEVPLSTWRWESPIRADELFQ